MEKHLRVLVKEFIEENWVAFVQHVEAHDQDTAEEVAEQICAELDE